MNVSAESIQQELTAVRDFVAAAEKVLESGHMPDMTGLEKRVALLCSAIETASSQIQQQCLAELGTLLQELNQCESHMRHFFETKMKPGHDKP